MNKNELRQQFLNIRNSLTEEYKRQAGVEICNKVINLPEYKDCSTLLCYIPVNDEVNTLPLILNAFESGKTVAVPYCENGNMCFKIISLIYDIEPGFYSIPTAKDGNKTLDDFDCCICIVPALAADKEFNRLGYGGGYYDRFLKSHPAVTGICVCYDECVTEKLPADEHDTPVNEIITQQHFYGGAFDVRR